MVANRRQCDAGLDDQTIRHQLDELIGVLSHAARDGRLEAALEPYVHPHVLVVDELGYQSYAADAANVLFRVVSIRHLRRRPTLVTTQQASGSPRPGAP